MRAFGSRICTAVVVVVVGRLVVGLRVGRVVGRGRRDGNVVGDCLLGAKVVGRGLLVGNVVGWGLLVVVVLLVVVLVVVVVVVVVVQGTSLQGRLSLLPPLHWRPPPFALWSTRRTLRSGAKIDEVFVKEMKKCVTETRRNETMTSSQLCISITLT